MAATLQGQTLRPLGLGEILDRAVNLSVKQFKTFSLIYAVFAVPVAVLNFFGTQDQARFIEALTRTLQQTSRSDPNALSRVFAQAPPLSPSTVALWVGLFLVSPLVTAALIDATSRAYLGGTPAFAPAYRTAVRHWLPLVGINVTFLGLGAVLYIVLLFAAIALGLALFAITSAAHVVGIVLAVILGIAAVIAAFLFAVVAVLALQLAYFACVVEDAPVFRAVRLGLVRVFGAVGLQRAVLVGLAWLAVIVAITVVTATGQALIFGVLHSPVIGAIYAACISIATAAFTTAFLGIFYFDVRVRTEGLDLQLIAAAAPAV